MGAPLPPVSHRTATSIESNTNDSRKLTKAAHEFEAILLQDWLEKMNKSFAGLEQGPDPAHDTISSMGTQAIAGALAARGGIGIANMILRQLQSAASSVGDTGKGEARKP